MYNPSGYQYGGPPPAGRNQTLAIISLVTGIVGRISCAGLVSPIAVITGFMARKRAAENPVEYGGSEIALVGLILGIIGSIVFVLSLLYFVFVFRLMPRIVLST
jgi:hypothetical protein